MIRVIRYNNQNFPIASNILFEKILNLDEKLTGQSVTIRSPFTKDKTPSFVIYFSTAPRDNYYRFKDFSSNLSGDAIDLFLKLYSKKYQLQDRQDAYYKLISIFKNNGVFDKYSSESKSIDTDPVKKYVSNYVKSLKWTKTQANFWRNHGVTKDFIFENYIHPIDHYEITIENSIEKRVLQFSPEISFGYFTSQGELHKIYNPGQKVGKFIKVRDCIQGLEQLKPGKKYCIIMSSLKDAGAFQGLGFKSFNTIVADSENITLSEDLIKQLQEDHELVFTMFDNDSAGMKAMRLYKEKFKIPYIHFKFEKDFAQCRYDHGHDDTKYYFEQTFMATLQQLKQNKCQ